MEKNSIDLAIALESLRLVDSYFHVSPPRSNRLQPSLKIDMPRWFYDDGSESRHPQLSTVVKVSFMLTDGPAPEQITPENSDKVAMTFGCAVDLRIGSPAMKDAIPAGKHVVIEDGNLETHRNKRMERCLIREALESAYAFASTRLIEASSLSPMGTITMPLPDYDELLDLVVNKQAK